jgi:hypothetical protein
MTRRYPRLRRRFSAATVALCFTLLFAAASLIGSCSSRLGWGVVLWTAPDGPLAAGSIVPVYIRSNIQKVFVVGVPGLKGKQKGKKIELPFWQVELFPTRGKAAARVKSLGANLSLYMIAARDGLPLRDKPRNGAKRVYRLREGQTVKVLDKVEGEVVSTGGQVLPGSWYQVLAGDGTKGYIFSYALRLYDEAKEGPPVLAAAKRALSGRVDLVFSRSWRPEYFQEMLDDGRMDLDYFSLRFGVFVDAVRRQIRIELPAASEVFNYKGISEAEGLYAFEGTPLKIRIESDKRMTCSWVEAVAVDATAADDAAPAGADPAAAEAVAEPAPDSQETVVEGYASAGSGGSAVFVVPSADALESIRLETLRRQKLLGAFVDGAGGLWASPQGESGSGILEVRKNGRFTWKNRGDAVAALIPAESGESGEIAFRLFLDPSIASSWNGVLSLRFDQPEKTTTRPKWLNFLFRHSPSGLVLAPARPLPASLIVQAADPHVEPMVLEPAAE